MRKVVLRLANRLCIFLAGEKPFACEHCPYRAAKQYNLDVHKRSRHGDTGGRDSNVCEQCGLGFR